MTRSGGGDAVTVDVVGRNKQSSQIRREGDEWGIGERSCDKGGQGEGNLIGS